MDPETQKRWDDWAKRIAADVAQKRCLATVDAISAQFFPILKAHREETEKLQRRVTQLEAQATGKVATLRTGTGG